MDPRDRKSDFILQIDFEWVKKTNNPKELRKGLAALREEGGYYDLEKEIEKKLEVISPSAKKPDNELTPQEKRTLDQDLSAWEEQMARQDKGLSAGEMGEVLARQARAEQEKQKGNEHMRARDYAMAIEAYSLACELEPTNAVVLSNRAQAHLSLKNFQKALEDSEAAIKLDGKFVKAYHRKGKALSAMQRYGDALPCFQKVLALDPSNTEAAAEVQKCREHVPDSQFRSIPIEEDSDESGSEGGSPDSIGEVDSANSEALSRAEAFKSEGNDLFQQGHFTEAIQRYNSALLELHEKKAAHMSEVKAALYNNLAACYSQTEELHRVIECSSAAVDLDQPNTMLKAKALLRRALAYEKMEKIDSAKRDMELVKGLDPGNLQASQALQRYAKVLLAARQLNATKRVLEVDQLLAQLDFLKDKGNKCFASEDLDGAILEFTAAITKLQTKMQEDEELKMHPQAIAKLVALLSNRALANLKLGCNAQVVQDCKAALAFDKNNVKALYRLAKAHENCGQLEEAVRCLERVVEIGPNNAGTRKELEMLKKRFDALKAPAQAEASGKPKKRRVSFRAELDEEIPAAESPAKAGEKAVSQSALVTEVLEASQPRPRPESAPKPKVFLSSAVVAEAKSIASTLISDSEAPVSATALYTRVSSMRPDLNAIGAYIVKQSPTQLCSLFQASQVDIDLMLIIFKALRTVETEGNWLFRLLDGLSATFRFDLTAKMFAKSDKRLIAELMATSTAEAAEKQRLHEKYRLE